MNKIINVNGKEIGESCKTFIIAEMSANHLMDYNRAEEIIKAAKYAGADAVKIQTYTPDTITINCDKQYFQITQGTIWDGTTLYKLYEKAYTPWEWHSKLKELAEQLGLIFFSSPFDLSAVDFLEKQNVPIYKIASFEITDIPLIKKVALTKKPIIISTGIAYKEDIELALDTCRQCGNEDVILLKCSSAYPAPYSDINLAMINKLKEDFDCVVGLSDHTLGSHVPVASIPMGSKVIEKHLTLKRSDGGPDGAFSMEPEEFRAMVDNIRMVEQAIGSESYELTEKQKNSREHSRSLFVVNNIKKGEAFTPNNVRSIRPGFGLHTKYYEEIIGKVSNADIEKGTPLTWEMVEQFR